MNNCLECKHLLAEYLCEKRHIIYCSIKGEIWIEGYFHYPDCEVRIAEEILEILK